MTPQLSPQDRCIVAREILHQPFKYFYGEVILDADSGIIIYWNPKKDAVQWLLLVEWLADRIHTLDFDDIDYFNKAAEVMACINKKDVDGLQSLVLELLP